MKAVIFSLFALLGTRAWCAGNDGVLLFSRGTWQANLHWLNGPAAGDQSVLQLDWKNAKQQPVVAPGDVVLSLFMPDMGHGSSPTTISPVLDASGNQVLGSYEITDMDFVMGGVWEVRLALSLNGHTETQSYQIQLPQ